MLTFVRSVFLFCFLATLIILLVPQKAIAEVESENKFNLKVDIYAAQASLMPYKGYQNDSSATVYLRYSDYQLQPFARYLLTNYYYQLSPSADYVSDRRTASGGGLDYQFNPFLRFRFIVESIKNKLSDTSYTQESYGIIYNQYLEFEHAELNNYLESFLIPRVASGKLDTFFKVQLLKSFYLNRSPSSSNAFYPFVQAKAKVNDDANFGVSGHNGSLGAGYRFYGVNAQKDSFSLVLEGHSVFYQSKNFNGDWWQMLAALQLWID